MSKFHHLNGFLIVLWMGYRYHPLLIHSFAQSLSLRFLETTSQYIFTDENLQKNISSYCDTVDLEGILHHLKRKNNPLLNLGLSINKQGSSWTINQHVSNETTKHHLPPHPKPIALRTYFWLAPSARSWKVAQLFSWLVNHWFPLIRPY